MVDKISITLRIRAKCDTLTLTQDAYEHVQFADDKEHYFGRK